MANPIPSWLPQINGQYPLIWMDFIGRNYWWDFAVQTEGEAIITDTIGANLNTPDPSFDFDALGVKLLAPNPIVMMGAGALAALNEILAGGGMTWVERWEQSPPENYEVGAMFFVTNHRAATIGDPTVQAIGSGCGMGNGGTPHTFFGATNQSSTNTSSSTAVVGLQSPTTQPFQIASSYLIGDHQSVSAMGSAAVTAKLATGMNVTSSSYVMMLRDASAGGIGVPGNAGPDNIGGAGVGSCAFLGVWPWQPDSTLPAFSNPGVFPPDNQVSDLLVLPLPTPLPCIPCCTTAAPVCQCPSP